MAFLQHITDSYKTVSGQGMPIGNLISQLFVNIYLDPLDKFICHKLGAKHYLRYADDFLILGRDPDELLGYFVEINQFLQRQLKLTIHPIKISLRKLSWGIDFVGYVALPRYNLPWRKTVKRILKKVQLLKQQPEKLALAVPSYLGYLSHASGYELEQKLAQIIDEKW